MGLGEGHYARPAVRRDARHDPALYAGGPGIIQVAFQIIESIEVEMCIKRLDHDRQIVSHAGENEQSHKIAAAILILNSGGIQSQAVHCAATPGQAGCRIESCDCWSCQGDAKGCRGFIFPGLS
jgi:hypothetical protein